MGLDMYLDRVKKVKGFSAENYFEVDEKIPRDIEITDIRKLDLEELTGIEGANELTKTVSQRGQGFFNWPSIREEVAYWRKCNAIHGWFVAHVQGGMDECEPHFVSKDDLEDLLYVVEELLTEIRKLNKNRVPRRSNNAFKEEYEKIKIPTELAVEKLPTQGGFFFGGTDYDSGYLYELLETKRQISEILEETDFENERLIYMSSW